MAETNYRELERKRTLQHYLTILARHWNGESVKEIAESLKMEWQSVQRDLEFIQNRYAGGASAARPKTSGVRQWMIETTCSACGNRISAGNDRLVIAALELTDEFDVFTTDYRRNGVSVEQGGCGQESLVGRRHFKHYCEGCAAKESEFLISNPVFVQAEALAASQPTQQGTEVPASVKMDLAAGDDRSFNETFPDYAPGEDAMARSTGMEEVGKHSGLGSNSLRVDPQSGEAAQRAKMTSFLNAATSRGMRNDMRTAARMWADGASQNEVARKLGKDQSTVSRWIKGARTMANAPR